MKAGILLFLILLTLGCNPGSERKADLEKQFQTIADCMKTNHDLIKQGAVPASEEEYRDQIRDVIGMDLKGFQHKYQMDDYAMKRLLDKMQITCHVLKSGTNPDLSETRLDGDQIKKIKEELYSLNLENENLQRTPDGQLFRITPDGDTVFIDLDL